MAEQFLNDPDVGASSQSACEGVPQHVWSYLAADGFCGGCHEDFFKVADGKMFVEILNVKGIAIERRFIGHPNNLLHFRTVLENIYTHRDYPFRFRLCDIGRNHNA
ncbi:unnamed protein product, partial [marine sediment metagenome]